jgi:hypothetical protein
VALAITLPAESILLRAISTPDSREAVRNWVAGLSAPELAEAVAEIQAYPFAYRKELMGALTPEERSGTWRGHIDAYLADHPELDETARIALGAAQAAMGPEAFATPTAVSRARIVLVAEQIEALLGREEAEYLMYRLGPADGTFASLEPWTERLANRVRDAFVALAGADDCECNTDFGCDGYFTHCGDSSTCEPDESWPMCGWGWMEECNGTCRGGMA